MTGGAGYIGAVLVPKLLEAGHDVTVLDIFTHGVMSLAACCGNPHFAIINGDVRNREILPNLVREADIVIPLAAVVGAPACERDEVSARTVNLGAIMSLSAMATDNQAIIYPNSNSGYGTTPDGTECDERTPLRPISTYGQTKAQAENVIMGRENSIALRLATVFGVSPRMRFDLMPNDFTLRAFRDRAIVLFEPHARRNFIHVEDVARVFLHAIENFTAMRGHVYNAGNSACNMTKLELCERIASHTDCEISVSDRGHDPDRRNYVVSNRKLERTGFACLHDLGDGVKEVLKSCRMIGRGPYGNV